MRLHKWSWSSSEGKLFGMASSKYFNTAAIRKPSDVTLGVSSTREKPLCYGFRTVPGRLCLFGSPSGHRQRPAEINGVKLSPTAKSSLTNCRYLTKVIRSETFTQRMKTLANRIDRQVQVGEGKHCVETPLAVKRKRAGSKNRPVREEIRISYAILS